MRAVVTGAAGFIGSRVVERLLDEGHDVVGIDCFTSYYDEEAKRSNLASAAQQPRFTLHESDLRTADLASMLADVDVVFHLAAQPGVRLSWAEFSAYETHNVLATQRLLDAAKELGTQRVVYASSSSVYGNRAPYPSTESDLPQPHSPYGVTKLAAEHLCRLYTDNWGVSTVSLRFFTVYGPRQRPDMATHRLVEAGIGGQPFVVFGDGRQVRDFTFVEDVVQAVLLAAGSDVPGGAVINVAGGSACTVNELIETVARALGKKVDVTYGDPQAGDVERTGGSIDQARQLLGWTPLVPLEDGVARQVEWHLRRRNRLPG